MHCLNCQGLEVLASAYLYFPLTKLLLTWCLPALYKILSLGGKGQEGKRRRQTALETCGWKTLAHLCSAWTLNTSSFQQGRFWEILDMSKDLSNALLHYKPLLFGVRERNILFSEEQNLWRWSPGQLPTGCLWKGLRPSALSKGAAEITAGLQLSACLILSPEEEICQMLFPSVQGPIHLSSSRQI